MVWIAVPVIAIAGGLAYAYSGSNDKPAQTQSASVNSAKKVSSKSSKLISESNADSSSSSAQTGTPDLTGLGFQIMPVLFNGEDVNQAMSDNKAPQNTVHDGSQLGYFSNRTQARMSGIAGYMYAHTVSYGVDDGMLSLNNWRIPIKVASGELQTVQWEAKDYEGNTITWKLEPLSDAKSVVEAHKNPDDKSTSPTEGEVDPHNLTTAQMEHWVRAYIESTVQAYNADDYTFTQKFVDGYAEVYEYKKDPDTGKSELAKIYRVDENGYLQVSNRSDRDNWQIASKKYE